MSPAARVACIIWAKDEQSAIGATVAAARSLASVDLVMVCDDGSTDATGERAAAAGAIVVTHARVRGKAAGIESAVNALGVLEARDGRLAATALLLLDADLEGSAASCAPLLAPVLDRRVDLAIGVPRNVSTTGTEDRGASGVVAGTAARGIVELTGRAYRAPLSGQRCLTRRAFELASPLAAGWGVEVGMTIDILRAGLGVEEVELDLRPRATGTDLTSQLDRAKQLRDVTRALAARGLVQAGWQDFKESGGVSGLLGRLRG